MPSGNCKLCGIYREFLHRDHVIPKCKGGPNTPDNIQLICANCHQDKTRVDRLGYRAPDSVKEKLRIAAKASWERRKGFKHTPETRAKMSAAAKGKPKSAEHRAKALAALRAVVGKTKGIPKSDAHKAKLRESNLRRLGLIQ